MLSGVQEIHRPRHLEEALSLLVRASVLTFPLAGGVLESARANCPLLAGLVALDAVVEWVSLDAHSQVPIGDYLARREQLAGEHSLITAVHVPPLLPGTGLAWEKVARTPADMPI